MSQKDRLLTLTQVRALTGLGRTTIWALERRGEFPKKRKPTERRIAYSEAEVVAWIASLNPNNPETPTADTASASPTEPTEPEVKS